MFGLVGLGSTGLAAIGSAGLKWAGLLEWIRLGLERTGLG